MTTSNTYLVRIDPLCAESGLRLATKEEFDAIKEHNKTVQAGEKRRFIQSRITEKGHHDDLYMEASEQQYREWRTAMQQRRRSLMGNERFSFLSLNALFSEVSEDDCFESDAFMCSDDMVINPVHERIFTEQLIEDLLAWKPWAYTVYSLFLSGNKSEAAKYLESEYCLKRSTAYNRINEFKKHIRSFLKKHSRWVGEQEGHKA